MKIRTQLFLLIVAALLPIVAFGVFMTEQFWNLQRDAYQDQFQERVRALRLAVDTEIDSTIRTLQSLAQSPALDAPSMDDFRDRLQRVIDTQPGWSMFGVIDADGTTRLVVRKPAFTIEVAADPKTTSAVVTSRAPAVSNLLVSADGKAYLTFIAVPVIRGPDVRSVLYVGIEHKGWLDFLRRYPIDSRAALTLADRDGLIIARTLNDERWVGKQSGASFWERARASPEGAFRSPGLEGQAFYSAFSRSTLSGWTIGTGVPQLEVEQDLRGSTLLTLGGFAGAALLALLLAFILGRRIAGGVRGLAESARKVADPDAPAAMTRPSRMARNEIEVVRTTLEESGARLRERQESLNEAMTREAQARAVAEHANLAKDQFLAMLGHELRNPLSAISNASALLERTSDPGVAARMRAIVQRQVQHLVRIVNDLLDVARITSGKVVLTKSVVDLAVVVVQAVEALKDAGRFAGLSLDVRVDSAPVLGDDTRLEQIATNLIENACKYTPQGGHVEVRVSVVDDHVELSVRDDGSGIAPDLLPHVFEVFVQGERTLDRAQGGLGLGLPVVKRLVDLHGGNVSAQSEGPGKGSRFVVRLPLHVGRADAVQTIVGPSPTGRLSVALVEDHPDTRESLRIVLEDEGHDVAVAHDGPSGVELIVGTRPDIALVDLGMPGFDGLEVARRVRAADTEREIRLVALSGYGAAEDRAAAFDAGFDEYMVKPFDLARFRLLTTRTLLDAAD
jgi:signal transduction histidine kinase